MSKKIIGNTVGTTLPRPSFAQTDPKKGDYIKDKEVLDTKYVKIDAQELTEEQKARVRENIGAGVLQVQADYSQNDETAVDYIKNRTHYEDIIDGAIVPNATYFIGGTQGFDFVGEKYDFKMPIVGKTYQITYGDIVTTKVAYTKHEQERFVYLGDYYNEFIMRFNINSVNAKVEMYIETASAGEKTISVTGAYLDKIHQLDEKYISTATDDDIIQMLVEAEIISPATDENGNLLTDENNSILAY